jgi:hypothetical protein
VVFGKRELSVVLVAVGVTVFCWVLLLAMSAEPTGAQTGGTTGETIRVQNDKNNRQYDDKNNRQYDDKNNRQYDDKNNRQYDEYNRTVIRNNQENRNITVEEQTVITSTIPGRPLPPTGGFLVYVMVAGSILAGAGLLALRFATQRGHHR